MRDYFSFIIKSIKLLILINCFTFGFNSPRILSLLKFFKGHYKVKLKAFQVAFPRFINQVDA